MNREDESRAKIATGRNMAEALRYLATVALLTGLSNIARKLNSVREDLIVTIKNEDEKISGRDLKKKSRHH